MQKIILGDEFDQILRDHVRQTLRTIGGTVMTSSWGVGGSQELSVEQWKIGESKVALIGETYIGLSLTGPDHIVSRVMTTLKQTPSKPC